MTDTMHTAFFGDTKRKFKLTPELVLELERKTGIGIGGLCRRLFAGEFQHVDIVETIRLGLIGGGAVPADAASLVATYATARPLGETYPIAVSILEVLWFGASKSEQAK